MNFGDILNEWDRRVTMGLNSKPAHSPVTPPRGGVPTERRAQESQPVDPLAIWLRDHGIYDKDAEEMESPSQAGERRRRLLHKRPDAVIDLHGLSQDEAWTGLEDFFRVSKQKGLEKVLIIHGKGSHAGSEGILRELVRRFIEVCPLAGESGHSHASAGGSGATWAILK
jgi:DNA-nicking Smr family endonuclease